MTDFIVPFVRWVAMGGKKPTKGPPKLIRQIVKAATAGSKHHRVAGFNIQGHFSISKKLKIQRSWGCLIVWKSHTQRRVNFTLWISVRTCCRHSTEQKNVWTHQQKKAAVSQWNSGVDLQKITIMLKCKSLEKQQWIIIKYSFIFIGFVCVCTCVLETYLTSCLQLFIGGQLPSLVFADSFGFFICQLVSSFTWFPVVNSSCLFC